MMRHQSKNYWPGSETQRVLGTSREPNQYETKWQPKAPTGLPNDIYKVAMFVYFFGKMNSLLLIFCFC